MRHQRLQSTHGDDQGQGPGHLQHGVADHLEDFELMISAIKG